MSTQIKEAIEQGKTYLGIELGSTRIKAVLIGEDGTPVASGGHTWENQYENGVWTYSLESVWDGMQDAYANLAADVQKKYGVPLTAVAEMGVSGMMHGYLAFSGGKLLAPFRTWRNTMTVQAAAELTKLFSFNIPIRWSISHLYQSILDGQEHVKDITYLTTLAGYVHWQLTGEKVMGVGEASGMFPIDSEKMDYDQGMVDKFDELVAGHNYPWKLKDIMPKVLCAGEAAGVLTEAGAKLLDPTGTLRPGIPFCPPEGDAGTGMVATNTVAVRTGNVSAGTSDFAMVVLEKPLSKLYEEIDMVTTPSGHPVAMVHCNNCTNELNAWAGIFQGFLKEIGQEMGQGPILDAMFRAALSGDPDGGGTVLYNFLSGEPIAGLNEGRPLMARTVDAKFDFANFSRVQLYSAMASLKLGLDILNNENVALDRLLGHGGYFKAPEAGQRVLAAAAKAPVSVMETAGEGGPWGIALLASYAANRAEGQSLEDYLDSKIFAGQKAVTVNPYPEDIEGFEAFMKRYTETLPVEAAAVKHLN